MNQDCEAVSKGPLPREETGVGKGKGKYGNGTNGGRVGVLRHLEEAKREEEAKKMRVMGKGTKLRVEDTQVC